MRIKLPLLLLTVLLAALLLTGCREEPPQDLELETVITPETDAEADSDPTPQPDSDPAADPEPDTDPAPAGPEPIWQITLNEGIVELYEEELPMETGTQTIRRYVYSTGETVEMGRLEASGGAVTLCTVPTGAAGTLHLYDAETDAWTETPLAAGTYRANWAALTLEDGSSALFYLPKVCRIEPQSSLEYLPDYDGTLTVEAVGDGWDVSLTVTLPDEAVAADYTVVHSPGALYDLSDPDCWETWEICFLRSTGLWCIDGFYRATPTDYTPTGTNYFYRCAASYTIKQMLEIAEAGQTGAKLLSIAMLDTVAWNQNQYGYWETAPQSGWLSTDYGLAGGFYDTRFNTDLAVLMVRAYSAWGGDRLRQTLERYGDFFLSYAEKYHFETATGWFVEDYYHPDGGRPTHSSLNHQAAECSLLYALAEALDRPELADLADTMVNAIRDTGLAWVMEDHDLYYCIYPDGTYGRDDYAYLTYNDLFTLQAALERRSGARDDTISAIMAEKKLWMDQNQVTGYWTE